MSQHSENWLEGALRQVQLLCKQATEYSEEYEVPTAQAVECALNLLREFQNAQKPQVSLTQDGEFVLTWKHFGDRFKAIAQCDGNASLYENKNRLDPVTVSLVMKSAARPRFTG